MAMIGSEVEQVGSPRHRRGRYGAPGRTWFTRRLAQGIGAVTALVAAVAVAAFALAPVDDADVWLELVKGAIQLLVVVALGGVVSFAVKRWEEDRAVERREDEARLVLLRELVRAYHRTKAVRRTLHAYGFHAGSRPDPLTTGQVGEFQKQMLALDEAQLAMETVAREIKAQPQIFSHAEGMHVLVHTAESFVNRVIGDWEEHGHRVVEGVPADVALRDLKHLRCFLGPSEQGIKRVGRAIEEVERLIRRQRLGASPRVVPFGCRPLDRGGRASPGRKEVRAWLERQPQLCGYDVYEQDGKVVAAVYAVSQPELEATLQALGDFVRTGRRGCGRT